VKHWAEFGLSAYAASCIVAGLALGVVFARRQRRLADPMVDLTLFGIPLSGPHSRSISPASW
jgi:DHA2 family multidrug resistance protein-like MFS transporter